MRPEILSVLNAEQIDLYERDGVLVLRDHLDRATIDRLDLAAKEVESKAGPLVPGNPRVQVEPSSGHARIRQAWPVIDLSETLRRLAADERITGVFRDLFGGETPVLFEDKLNYKPPGIGSPFALHQDYSYWGGYSPRLASALLLIDEATAENGCLEVVPGRHREGLFKRTEIDVGPVKDHFIPPEILSPSLTRKVEGAPGTMIFFSCFTPHASGPNRSDRFRRALILTYNPESGGDGYEETSGANRERARKWLEKQTER